jgi:hypothetical protein
VDETIRKAVDSQLSSAVRRIVDDPAAETLIRRKISDLLDAKLTER